MGKKVGNTICIISQYFPPDFTGDVVRLTRVLKVLTDKGFKVTIVTAFPHYPDGKIPSQYKKKLLVREKWNDIDVIRTYVLPLPHTGFINRLLIYTSFSLSALLALFILKRVKVIWSFSQKFFSYFTGMMFKLVLRTPLLLDVVDVWPEGLVNAGFMNKNKKLLLKIIKIPFKIFYKISNRIITLHEAMKKLLVNSAKISPSKIFILPNIIDIEKFKPVKVTKKPFKNQFIVMYTGNLGRGYDFRTLLEAASILKNEKGILFIIKGTGEMKQFILQFLEKNQINNVYFDEKILDIEEYVKYINKADILVLPMKKCPYPNAFFPIKLIDYLSCGKPAIYCGDGYAADLINSLVLGIAISPKDPQSLSKAVLTLKNNEKLRRKMGKNARKVAEKMFSEKILEQKVKNIFGEWCYNGMERC